jgi:hypothetical protein
VLLLPFFSVPLLFSAFASSNAEGKYASENLMITQLGGGVSCLKQFIPRSVPTIVMTKQAKAVRGTDRYSKGSGLDTVDRLLVPALLPPPVGFRNNDETAA